MTEAAIQTKERGWIHASRIKGPVDKPKEWTITSEPGDTKLTLKRGLGDAANPFQYDWCHLRVGGLVVAAVLSVVGIIVLFIDPHDHMTLMDPHGPMTPAMPHDHMAWMDRNRPLMTAHDHMTSMDPHNPMTLVEPQGPVMTMTDPHEHTTFMDRHDPDGPPHDHMTLMDPHDHMTSMTPCPGV
ncbi:hypothetical protein DUI87_19259 [Hirundo rustica rustica]|uniref:FXYD domain-containing ion transport regulator n=1 Tax=Hirundo rustica rustica TaxID=333673 RepID=A0A3M0JSC9_HIRRU|nr:hypothetical protein DUI87_19259 [Hirundo rustica rustica]